MYPNLGQKIWSRKCPHDSFSLYSATCLQRPCLTLVIFCLSRPVYISWKDGLNLTTGRYWNPSYMRTTPSLTYRALALCMALQYFQIRYYSTGSFLMVGRSSTECIFDSLWPHWRVPVSAHILQVVKLQGVLSEFSKHPGVKQFLEYIIDQVPHFLVHVAAVYLHNSTSLVLSTLVRLHVIMEKHSSCLWTLQHMHVASSSWLEKEQFHIVH